MTSFQFNPTQQNAGIVPNRLRYHSFDQVTGTIYLAIPEPAAIALATWSLAVVGLRRRSGQ